MITTNPGRWDFHGGIHRPDMKTMSAGKFLGKVPLPDILTLPLQQHIGAMAEPTVSVGDQVYKGQTIARVTEYIGAPIHAPTSGTIIAIEEKPVPHPSGLSAPCILLQADGNDEWGELPEPLPYFDDLDPSLLRERIRWAGIVGLGGAAFPTSVKVNHGPDRPIQTLVVNGAECEPYITCDDLLMRNQADRIVEGIKILLYVVDAEECLIGIEDNKPEAIAAMRQAVAESGLENVQVVQVPTRYPMGGEKQLIRVLTGKEVPSHGIPSEVGVICVNVATTAAVTDAIMAARPLLSRLVTVTGAGAGEPGNLEVAFGTPMSRVIEHAGGYSDKAYKLILGGPMMGFTLGNDDLPITKGTNCLLIASREEAPDPDKALPCIRCGKCVDACPAQLLPQQLYWYARSKDFDKTQEYNLFDCIECGCCSWVCPSHIPLVQYYRFAKTETWAMEKEKQQAEEARRRHEAKVERLERLDRERKARLRQKKDALEKKTAAGGADPKKAAVDAAMKRVAAKKARQAQEKNNTEERP
ncbi:electron transport complex subunit RsxC [Thiolapillus sp.]|uniref:electron transport complex subunit RsxC n=6 Tax=Thiolapillus sp. TaxID=2017437 RepID=UPI0025ECB8C1|nr:electron transport complex subunit RsxC [Thiolapillus sp.]